MIVFWPSSVGFDFPQFFSALWMLSMISSQGVFRFVLFPIHAPNNLMASPFFAILMWSFSGIWSFGFSLQDIIILYWCVSDPIGITSVFSMLNFAPDTQHHSSRMSWTWSRWSSFHMKMFVSSANMVMIIFSSILVIFNPLRLGSSLSLQASGSIAKLKRAHNSGSSWRTPCVTL